MATSDGISTEDWDRVYELAVNIANASRRAEEGEEVRGVVEAYKNVLLQYLDDLAIKYGPLPSIFATRADYVNDSAEKHDLLNKSYVLAKSRGDVRNQLYAASSLARLYIEDLRQSTEGEKWLTIFGEHLTAGDDSDQEEYDDAFIVCWQGKYTYWTARPDQMIPGFTSYIKTPPFPGYPSGHSTQSGAASEVLAYLFPDQAATFRGMAEEAALSRLYGGIHFPSDNNNGLQVGREVGRRVIEHARAALRLP